MKVTTYFSMFVMIIISAGTCNRSMGNLIIDNGTNKSSNHRK